MLQCVVLLVLANICSGNRYEAADAIQFAIFGGDDTPGSETQAPDVTQAPDMTQAPDVTQANAILADMDSVTEPQRDRTEAADESFDDLSSTDTGDSQSLTESDSVSQSQTFGTEHHSHTSPYIATHAATATRAYQAAQTSARRTSALRIVHAAQASVRRTSGYAHATQTGGPHNVGHMQVWAGPRNSQYGSHGTRAPRRRTTKPTTTTPPPRGPRKPAYSGKSYSFAQLSSMSAQSAPGQKGMFYMPTEYEQIPRVEPCQAVKCHLSVVVVMDSSGSVGYSDYQKELSFVKTLLEILAVKAADSKLKVCTGLISYSTDVHVEVDPCCENSICRVVDQFHAGRLEFRAGSTNTAGALKVARQMLQAAASHKKVALLITDGKSNTGGSPVPFAKQMRDEDGIQIVALGVTIDVNKIELKGVSGMDRVTKIDVFDEFHELASILLQANKVASQNELETSFDAMCYNDKTFYNKDQCTRVMTEEQKSQCVWGEWSECDRVKDKCLQLNQCELSGIVVARDEQACECPPCQAGFYLTLSGHCEQCGANTYKSTEATSCSSCPADTVSDPGSTSITDCHLEFEIVDEHGNVVSWQDSEGLLLYNGGTVCDDYFTTLSANAICKRMGRPHGLALWASGLHYSVQDSLSIKLDDVKCTTSDWDKCTFRTTHNCGHSEDVHINCMSGKETAKPSTPKTEATEGPATRHTDPGHSVSGHAYTA
ncbi:uncharacterized protein LOC134821777 [Bolinopsis microptera]|uniref:uncharacterized protein LOC134821777 n=1 Tax=Bolinopsis microptera TaxID=2820187 RepID=UPI00307A6162